MFRSVDRPNATWSGCRPTSNAASSLASTRSPTTHSDHTPSHFQVLARADPRVGGLRIVFTVDRERRVVEVSDIGPRGDIYRRL